MKKTNLFILFILFTASMLSCSENDKSGDKPETTEKNVSGTNEQKTEIINYLDTLNPNAIALKMNTGSKFSMLIDDDEELTGELSDEKGTVLQKQKLKQVNNVIYDCEITNVTGNGNFVMDITFARIKSKIDAGQLKQQTFDSKNHTTLKDVPPEYYIPYSLVGKTYNVTLTPLGKLVKVNKIASLTETIVNELKDTKITGGQIKEILKKEFDFDKLYNYFSKLFNYANGKVHKRGDTWKNQYRQNLDKTVTVNSKYELVKYDKIISKIKIEAELADTQPDSENINGVITTKKRVGGSLSGIIKINNQTGFIIESHYSQIFNVDEEQINKNKPDKILHSKLKRITKHNVIVKQKK